MKKAIRKVAAAFTAAVAFVVGAASAYAADGGLANSVAVTGTQRLLGDLSNILLVVAPLIGTACIIYFAVRHGAADEMDQKKWKQRIIVAS